MPPNSEARRARGELARLRAEAIERLVDLHPEALHQALQVYGELLVSSDIVAIMIKREQKLSLRHQAELAALRQDQIYGRNWSGLFRLLIDLLKKGGRP